MFNRKAVFFDRDGTLIKAIYRPGFVKSVTAPFFEKELQIYSDAWDAIDRLRVAGFLTVMVTNQPDVAHGYMSEDEWQKIHRAVIDALDLRGFVYMCRHRTHAECDRKKPSPKMLFDAADNLGIDLSKSYMIGDTDADMKAGKAAGCWTILLNRDYNKNVQDCDMRVDTLTDAVRDIKLLEGCSEKIKKMVRV